MNLFSRPVARTSAKTTNKRTAKRPARSPSRFSIEHLEDRQLMSVNNFAFADASTTNAGRERNDGTITEQVADQRMALPMLDSLPGAPRTLHLDFTGNFERDWYQTHEGQVNHYYNLSTPAYNTDFTGGAFSLGEQQEIRNIWAAVAEDFAPFNINVTTHYYGSFDDGKALKVVFGGDDNWLNRAEDKNISGTSDIRSYLTPSPNTVFVFTDNFGNNSLYQLQIATTASHEAGHAFSLLHRSVWSADGKTVTKQYDPGTDVWTPIMGQHKSTDRTTWGRGVTEQGAYTWQDEFATLGGLLGFRADEPALTTLTSNSPTAYGATLVGAGVINTATDVDVFQFTTGGGQIKITAKAAQIGANLIPVVELCSASTLIRAGTPNGFTQSVIDVNLPAGTYYLRMKGAGDYGDVGQYTVSVATTRLTAPTTGGRGGTSGGATLSPLVADLGTPTTAKLAATDYTMVSFEPGRSATFNTLPASIVSSDGASDSAKEIAFARTRPATRLGFSTPTISLGRDSLWQTAADAAFTGLDQIFG